jgi:hypothetical protein
MLWCSHIGFNDAVAIKLFETLEDSRSVLSSVYMLWC